MDIKTIKKIVLSSIGQTIIEAREKLHLSQQELAILVKVTPSYLCRIEKGATPPSDDFCARLAAVLKLDADDLRRKALAVRESPGLAALVSSVTPEERKFLEVYRMFDLKGRCWLRARIEEVTEQKDKRKSKHNPN